MFCTPIVGKIKSTTIKTYKITLTGDLGSGKSAVSAILCKATGFAYISTGKIQRQLAAEMDLDTLELNRRADIDPEIDKKIDSIFINLGDALGGYVVDSRMAWHFLPNSFKVYLKTDIATAARRIIDDPNRKSEDYQNEEEAIAKIKARKLSENNRFLLKYKADCSNMNNFDLVVDTSNLTPEAVSRIILRASHKWQKGLAFLKFRK